MAIKPGTRILREWRGFTYRVTALDNGFAYDDRVYASLSEMFEQSLAPAGQGRDSSGYLSAKDKVGRLMGAWHMTDGPVQKVCCACEAYTAS